MPYGLQVLIDGEIDVVLHKRNYVYVMFNSLSKIKVLRFRSKWLSTNGILVN